MSGALLILLGTGDAHAVLREFELCLEFQKTFGDAAGGDIWTDNEDNAMARGVRVAVTDDWQSQTAWLSTSDGCSTFTVDVTTPFWVVQVQAWSKAKVNGVEVHSYVADTNTIDTVDTDGGWSIGWENQDMLNVQWNSVQVLSDPTTKTLVLDELAVWTHLAVATMTFRKNDFNLGDGPDRDCCTNDNDASYDPDGTCTTGDYVTIDPPVRIFHGLDARDPQVTCGASSVLDTGGGRHPAMGLPSEVNCGKYVTAHELAHVTVEMRTGGRTETHNNAGLDGCDGSDGIPEDGRGVFQKEYVSTALREGFADWVAAWTWNKRTQSDCIYQAGLKDFDLDGTIDNDAANNDNDGQWDCHGTPFVNSDTAAPMDNTNWLDDLEDTAYVSDCDRHADDDVEANRTTVYDVAKMFWQLNHENGQDVGAGQVADLYVDMCPRQWASDDDQADTGGGVYVEDDLPLERLQISAAEHGLTTELDAVLPHVEH